MGKDKKNRRKPVKHDPVELESSISHDIDKFRGTVTNVIEMVIICR